MWILLFIYFNLTRNRYNRNRYENCYCKICLLGGQCTAAVGDADILIEVAWMKSEGASGMGICIRELQTNVATPPCALSSGWFVLYVVGVLEVKWVSVIRAVSIKCFKNASNLLVLLCI